MCKHFDGLFKVFGKRSKRIKGFSFIQQCQPNGERQLLDLNSAVDFISNEFDGFKGDRLEKEKIIKDSKEEVTYLRGKVDDT